MGTNIIIKNRRSRSKRGQALVEGAASAVVLSLIIVGGVLLVIGSGLAVYYKSKLALAAAAGAQYGAQGQYFLGARRSDYMNDQLQADVTSAVNAVLTGEGLPAARGGNIRASSVTRNGVAGMEVMVQESGLEIISGGFLPTTINLTETAFYPYSNDKPTALLEMSIGGTGADKQFRNQGGQGLYLPMYGGGAAGRFNPNGTATQGPVPLGEFPTWKVAVSGEEVPGISLRKERPDLYPPGVPLNTIPLSRVEKYGVKESTP
ncbi:MAG: hypothetical protein K2W82_15180 [Candidatus Obscuribacterales bacterium]|nr:hypothetical protein [Candidatus Obscuribacterales bacterium]